MKWAWRASSPEWQRFLRFERNGRQSATCFEPPASPNTRASHAILLCVMSSQRKLLFVFHYDSVRCVGDLKKLQQCRHFSTKRDNNGLAQSGWERSISCHRRDRNHRRCIGCPQCGKRRPEVKNLGRYHCSPSPGTHWGMWQLHHRQGHFRKSSWQHHRPRRTQIGRFGLLPIVQLRHQVALPVLVDPGVLGFPFHL